MLTVARFTLRELARSRWIGAYALFFAAVGWAMFYFGEEAAQVMVSVLALVLLLVPLVGLVVGVFYFYGAREYARLVLTQPVARQSVFAGQYLGLSLPVAAAFAVGLAVPFLWYGSREANGPTLVLVFVAGIFLTFIFVALGFLISVRIENQLKVLGVAIALWLFFAVIYDGLLLAGIMAFPERELGKPLLALILLNPLDMGRVLILLRLDIAALMGHTGAVFREFLGSAKGERHRARKLASLDCGALRFWYEGLCAPRLLTWVSKTSGP